MDEKKPSLGLGLLVEPKKPSSLVTDVAEDVAVSDEAADMAAEAAFSALKEDDVEAFKSALNQFFDARK